MVWVPGGRWWSALYHRVVTIISNVVFFLLLGGIAAVLVFPRALPWPVAYGMFIFVFSFCASLLVILKRILFDTDELATILECRRELRASSQAPRVE